jgi:RNase P subunit RPR2
MSKRTKIVTISKRHKLKPVRCQACGRLIKPGERALRKTSANRGKHCRTNYLCMACADASVLVYPVFKRSN